MNAGKQVVVWQTHQLGSETQCWTVSLSSCHPVSLSPCQLITLSPCLKSLELTLGIPIGTRVTPRVASSHLQGDFFYWSCENFGMEKFESMEVVTPWKCLNPSPFIKAHTLNFFSSCLVLGLEHSLRIKWPVQIHQINGNFPNSKFFFMASQNYHPVWKVGTGI